MSNVSSREPNPYAWNPWLGVLFVIIVYYVSQVIGGLIVWLYPLSQHWSSSQAVHWLDNSITAQFIYVLAAETLTIGAIYLFLRRKKLRFSGIGLKKPRWSDPVYGLAALLPYFLLYTVVLLVVKALVPGLDIDQQQQIGFDNVQGNLYLLMTFVGLVILPAFTEELMVRGLLYTSLKRVLRPVAAVLLTSAIFASAHLPEGGAAGPLYVAAIDTFILSLVLIYLREKTGSLWASITLHAAKNSIAFVALFVLHVH